MEHDEDHFRKAQEHISENSRQALLALEQSAKDNSKWLAALCCSISLDIRRPAVNAKKRRLDLDIPQRPAERLPSVEKRQKSIEDKVVVEDVKTLPPGEVKSPPSVDQVAAKLRSSRNPSRKRSIHESEDDDEPTEELNPFAMKVAELKQELKDRGLKTAGLKASLIARLLEAIETEKSLSENSARSNAHGASGIPHVKTDMSRHLDDKSDEIVEESDASFVEAQSPHEVDKNCPPVSSKRSAASSHPNEQAAAPLSTKGGSVENTAVEKKSADSNRSKSARPTAKSSEESKKRQAPARKVESKPPNDSPDQTKHSRKSRMARFVNLHPPIAGEDDDADGVDGSAITEPGPTDARAEAASTVVDLVSPDMATKRSSRQSPKSKKSSPVAAKMERRDRSTEQTSVEAHVIDLVSPGKTSPSPKKPSSMQSPKSCSPVAMTKHRHAPAEETKTKPVPNFEESPPSLGLPNVPSIVAVASPRGQRAGPEEKDQRLENATAVESMPPTNVQPSADMSPPRTRQTSPGSPKSPPVQSVRKVSLHKVEAPSHPTKAVKAVALFDTTVSPFLPSAQTTAHHTAAASRNSMAAADEPKTSLHAAPQPILEPQASRRPHESQPLPSIRSNRKLLDDDDDESTQDLRPQSVPIARKAPASSRRPLFGGDISPIASTDESSNTRSSATNSPPRAFSVQPRRDDEAVGVPKSDLLMSTAASLFASATSPIVKGFASIKSAFGLANSDATDLYSRTTPVPKVPAPKVFQTKATFATKRQAAPSTLYEQSQVRGIFSLLEKPAARPRERADTPTKEHRSPAAPTSKAGTEDPAAAKEREFQETIERESKRLRLAAKESAKKRIEQEMDTFKASSKGAVASMDDLGDDHTVSTSASVSSVGKMSDPHDSHDLDEVTMSLPSAESSLNESSASEAVATHIASGVAKKPSNLVSGLHSLTTLVEKDSTSQPVSNSRGAGPSVVSALRMAERNRVAEQKRLLEKKKRKEELLKKYEEQRKLDEEKRRKATSASTKEQNEKAARELRAKREREAREKKERETELAKKKQHRLQDMQALDEKKKQLAKEKELAVKDRVEKMRHDGDVNEIALDNVPRAPSAPATTNSEKSTPSATSHLRAAPVPQLAHATSNAQAAPAKPSVATAAQNRAAKENTPSKNELTNYEMSDGPESDDSGNSDTEQKKIPTWAQREALEQALARQFGPSAIDPTPAIFPDFVDSCDLEAIFQPADAKKKKRFNKRTSSGNWLADRPTMREKVAYKRDMGFK